MGQDGDIAEYQAQTEWWTRSTLQEMFESAQHNHQQAQPEMPTVTAVKNVVYMKLKIDEKFKTCSDLIIETACEFIGLHIGRVR